MDATSESPSHEAETEHALTKPERPRAPTKPDLRTGSDAAKAARQNAYDAALVKHAQALAHYDNVLYPAYRAGKKKAARPSDDGAQAVKRRMQNPEAAANHRQREAERQAEIEAVDEQLRFIELCERAIRCTFTLDGSDNVRQYNNCDKPMLRAVLDWFRDHPPDGSQAWWLSFSKTAKAAQSKQQTLRWTALMYGLSPAPVYVWLMRGLHSALNEVEPHEDT